MRVLKVCRMLCILASNTPLINTLASIPLTISYPYSQSRHRDCRLLQMQAYPLILTTHSDQDPQDRKCVAHIDVSQPLPYPNKIKMHEGLFRLYVGPLSSLLVNASVNDHENITVI